MILVAKTIDGRKFYYKGMRNGVRPEFTAYIEDAMQFTRDLARDVAQRIHGYVVEYNKKRQGQLQL